MNKHTQAISNDLGAFAEDTRSLMAATADMAEEKAGEARKQFAAALESGQEMYGRVRDKAVDGAKAMDQAMHDHPYHGVGIAFGVGALIGLLLSRTRSRSGD